MTPHTLRLIAGAQDHDCNEDLARRLEIMSGMLTMGEPIAFGADAALMAEAASRLRAGGGGDGQAVGVGRNCPRRALHREGG